MKAAHDQTPAQRAQIRAEFEAHPQVAALHAAVANFADARGLRFDAEGMSQVAVFAAAWQREHGPVPDSGLAIG